MIHYLIYNMSNKEIVKYDTNLFYSNKNKNEDNNIINYNNEDNSSILGNVFLYFLIFIFIIRVGYIFYYICKPETNTLKVTLLTTNLVQSDIDEVNECSICLEENSLDKSIKLHCNHIFHKDCIKKWHREVNTNLEHNLEFTCPLCKSSIV